MTLTIDFAFMKIYLVLAVVYFFWLLLRSKLEKRDLFKGLSPLVACLTIMLALFFWPLFLIFDFIALGLYIRNKFKKQKGITIKSAQPNRRF